MIGQILSSLKTNQIRGTISLQNGPFSSNKKKKSSLRRVRFKDVFLSSDVFYSGVLLFLSLSLLLSLASETRNCVNI